MTAIQMSEHASGCINSGNHVCGGSDGARCTTGSVSGLMLPNLAALCKIELVGNKASNTLLSSEQCYFALALLCPRDGPKTSLRFPKIFTP
jgi:hypothetical protein